MTVNGVATTTAINCPKCDRWLGASPEPVVHIETVRFSDDVRIDSPYLWFCKTCTAVHVFIKRDRVFARLGVDERRPV